MDFDHTDYTGIVRQLARPTLGQTERFARYVSGAHSWYKHLPIRPKRPFVFYLDPGAGMNRVHTRTGEVALVPITDESTQFHYTWQKTEEYRRRFGYWTYHAPYGLTFMCASDGGLRRRSDAVRVVQGIQDEQRKTETTERGDGCPGRQNCGRAGATIGGHDGRDEPFCRSDLRVSR